MKIEMGITINVTAMAVVEDNRTEFIVAPVNCSKGIMVEELLTNQYINTVDGIISEQKIISAQNRKLGICHPPNLVIFCPLAEPVDVLK